MCRESRKSLNNRHKLDLDVESPEFEEKTRRAWYFISRRQQTEDYPEHLQSAVETYLSKLAIV